MSAHDFSFPALDGGEISLATFANRAVLLVNTASACGYAQQFSQLQGLYDRLGDRGLMVVAVPSDDFGGQEPLGEAEIARHYREDLGLTFPVTGKTQVVGQGRHRFFAWLLDQAGEAAEPGWNFHKVLLDPAGELVGVWPSRVEPDSRAVVDAVESVLPG
jgi:glutathione peroxidase